MKAKIAIIFILSIFLAGNIFSSVSALNLKENYKQEYPTTSEWTVMVYLDGDNNLETYAIDDFLEMATIGSNSNVNILVQLDRTSWYDTRYGDWTTTKRYRITQGMIPDSASAISDIGEANMGDPQTVINFVNWAISNYPANKYCFIFWDHGSGWKYPDYGPRKDVCYDDTDMDVLSTAEIGYALNMITSGGLNKIGLIGFDACLMQMFEVGYEIKDYALYMTASEDTEPVTGWNYQASFAKLITSPSMSPESLGAEFVNYYSGVKITLSTVELGSYNYLIFKINDLATSLKQAYLKVYLQNILQDVEKFDDYNFIDLYHFAQLVESQIPDQEIKNKALSVMYAISSTVKSEVHDSHNQNAHGISIYFPYYIYDTYYSTLKFAEDSTWDELISWYCGSSTSNPPSAPVITGPYNGMVGVEYMFRFVSSDPDGDDIYYNVGWGDASTEEWLGPKKDGEPCDTTHIWNYEGAFTIKVKAVDVNGAESGWSYYHITMPRNRAHIFIQRIIKNFPFLSFILQLTFLNKIKSF